MEKKLRISEAELEIMYALWGAGGWSTVGEVCEAVAGRSWKYKTVGTFLLRLQEKGFVESRKEGNINQYHPCLTEMEYKRMETDAFLQEVHGGSVNSLLAALSGGTVSAETLAHLADWLKQQEPR